MSAIGTTRTAVRRAALCLSASLVALASLFEVPAATGATTAASPAFTIAVLPDTQSWTGRDDGRFRGATAYLAANRGKLNLKQVVHTGDVVNWGWLVPGQYAVATRAMQTLRDAAIPFTLAVGNHDTRVVGWDGRPGSRGYGGSAYADNPGCPSRLGAAQCRSRLLIRHTEEFDRAFPASRQQAGIVQYRAGQVANQYVTFSAGDTRWLVLDLEFCPRPDAVQWARSVVAAHPRHNVVVNTHYYLDGDGSIGRTNQGYGSTSPKYVYDNLISRYANIRLVLSGHIGRTAYREDTGVNGNRIVSMMLNDLGTTANALRLVTVDPATGRLTSRIYAPNENRTYSQYSRTSTVPLVR